jgi:YegS/Rv2252/BmrU family lipid kinase
MDTGCLVLVNHDAGGGHDGDGADALRAKLQARGLDAEVVVAQAPGEIGDRARAAAARGCALVVGAGGDGTINQVAAAVAGSGSELGVLPLGTLNHFAKDLGIPLELDAAIEALAGGRTIAVDAASVNDRLFLNNSSIGLYPAIVRDRERQQQRLGRGKWPAFVFACITALRRYPFLSVQVECEGRTLPRRSAFVFVGNNHYDMEGLDIGSRARLDAGTLSLAVSRDVGRLGLLALALRALFGRLSAARDLDVFDAPTFRIETGHARLQVSTDGEVVEMDAPLDYRSLPGRLSVRVPRASAGEASDGAAALADAAPRRAPAPASQGAVR